MQSMNDLNIKNESLHLYLWEPARVRALRSVASPIRVLEVYDNNPDDPFHDLYSSRHPEQVWTDLIWFLRNHTHLRQVKLDHAVPQSASHKRRLEACFGACFEALTDNRAAQLEHIATSFMPRCPVLLRFLAAHHRHLTHMTLFLWDQVNDQLLVESDGDGRTLFSLPASYMAQMLRALLHAAPSLHTIQIYANSDASPALWESHGFVASLQQRSQRSISGLALKVHNHSMQLRPRGGGTPSIPPSLSPQFLRAILTSKLIRSLVVSGFTIPDLRVPSDDQSLFTAVAFSQLAQNSCLTELHLCHCHLVEPASLQSLLPSLPLLETLRIQRLIATSDPSGRNLTSWLKKDMFLHVQSLSTLDLQGTPLDTASMEQLCSWTASAGIVSLSLGNAWTSKNVLSDAAVLSFLKRLPEMRHLYHVHLGHCMSSCSVGQALLSALKRHDGIRALEGLKWAQDLVSYQPTVEFFVRLNRCGRRLLTEPNSVPPGLWARILSRAASDERDWELVYSFLRSGGGTQGI